MSELRRGEEALFALGDSVIFCCMVKIETYALLQNIGIDTVTVEGEVERKIVEIFW